MSVTNIPKDIPIEDRRITKDCASYWLRQMMGCLADKDSACIDARLCMCSVYWPIYVNAKALA